MTQLPSFSLAGHAGLLTGSSQGIGSAVANAMHAAGANLSVMLKCIVPVAAVFLTAAVPANSAADPVPLDVGNRRQLFLDQLFLQDARGVQLRTHQPRKTGEHTIPADRPWEKGGLGPYSSVLWDQGKYHLWYHAMDQKLWDSSPTAGSICYATSEDGITWRKPDLGLIAYAGNRKNNIVVGHGAAGLSIGQDGMMVFVDPNAPAVERLRMVNRFSPKGEGKTDGVNILSSADGIHWKLTQQNVMTYRPEVKGHHLDSQNVIFWDADRKAYVAYVRRNLKGTENQGRAIARGESSRLGDFPVAQDLPVVLTPDEPDSVHHGISVVDYYNSAAVRYPWADRAYFIFPQAYYHYTRQLHEYADGQPTNAGPLDTQFAASRDGLRFERYDRRPFIPLGQKGEFDCHSARMIYGMVPDRSGREIYLYYRASDWLHGWDRNERNRELLTRTGVGADRDIAVLSRVVLRRDGFVSVTAGHESGEFLTPPLKFAGRRLQLNVDTSAIGYVRVACVDGFGQPITGFGLDDCDLIHTANDINRVVTWRGSADLPQTPGGILRLKFALRNTDLYAFQFTAE